MSAAVACALLALATIVGALVVMVMVMRGASVRALEVASGVMVTFAVGAVVFRLIAAY